MPMSSPILSDSEGEESPVAPAVVSLKTAGSFKTGSVQDRKQRPRVRSAPAPVALDRGAEEDSDEEDVDSGDDGGATAFFAQLQQQVSSRKRKSDANAKKEARRQIEQATDTRIKELAATVQSANEEFGKAVQEADAYVRSQSKKYDASRAAFEKELSGLGKDIQTLSQRVEAERRSVQKDAAATKSACERVVLAHAKKQRATVEAAVREMDSKRHSGATKLDEMIALVDAETTRIENALSP